jgi:hypothetical protein
MAVIIKEKETRPAHAVSAPIDYEERAMDLAIAALDDIAELDEAKIYIKWDKMPGGVVAPLLYVLFSEKIADGNLPRVHLDDKGVLRPAHAVCLARMPSGTLLEGQKLKDVVRRGVEDYLRKHNVRPTPIACAVPALRAKLSP